jgi:hypothetical protein
MIENLYSETTNRVIIDGTYEDENLTVEERTGGMAMITVTACEYGETVATASVLLDYDGRQALIRALQNL